MPRTSPLLSVIIVNYNTAELTLKAVQSVDRAAAYSPVRFKVSTIIVDNHSQDNSVSKFQHWLSTNSTAPNHRVKLIASPTNSGFAAANNLGLQLVRAKYYLLLNSDAQLFPDALWQLWQTYEHYQTQGLGLLAGNLQNSDGSVQHQGGDLPTLLGLTVHLWGLAHIPVIGKRFPSTQKRNSCQRERGNNQLLHGLVASTSMTPAADPATASSKISSGVQSTTSPAPLICKKGWVGGTALFFSDLLYQQLGPLDQNIFMYGEDVEYSWRCTKAGYWAAICCPAKVVHLGSKSSSHEAARVGELENLPYILRKHLPRWQTLIACGIISIATILREAYFTFSHQPKLAAAYKAVRTKILKQWRSRSDSLPTT